MVAGARPGATASYSPCDTVSHLPEKTGGQSDIEPPYPFISCGAQEYCEHALADLSGLHPSFCEVERVGEARCYGRSCSAEIEGI